MDKHNIDGTKIQYHIPEISQWLDPKLKHKVFPIYVEISPVGQCNHRCTFCAVDYIGYKNRYINTKVMFQTLTNMKANGVKSIMFAGEGEPTLHPQIADITNHAGAVGLDVSFTTNGTGLNKQFIDETLASCTWIKISMNGGNPKTYANIHRTTERHWKLVWDNITYAIERRNSLGLKCTIGVQSLLLPENADSLLELGRKCKSIGLDYCVIKPYSHHLSSKTVQYKDIRYGSNYENLLHSLDALNWDDDVSSKFELITRTESMKGWDSPARQYHKCYSTPYFWAYIMATGDVYGCSAYLQDPRFCYGNINDQSFSSIWMGDKRTASIKYVEEELDISECRKNCRMDKVNKFLWDVKNPGEHKNFI